jgi:hypothetical protein
MDETLLSKIIHGYREPTPMQRRSLANHLAVEENWLFEKYESATHKALEGDSQQVTRDGVDEST